MALAGETRSHGLAGDSGRTACATPAPAAAAACSAAPSSMPGMVNLYAGSLDDTAQFKPRIAIFVRSRPPWDTSSNGLECFETVPTA